MQDYDYKIEYKAGAKNRVADALSRRAGHAEPCVCAGAVMALLLLAQLCHRRERLERIADICDPASAAGIHSCLLCNDARPKKPRNSVRFFGVGHVRIAATLSISMPMPSGEMTWPKKLACF